MILGYELTIVMLLLPYYHQTIHLFCYISPKFQFKQLETYLIDYSIYYDISTANRLNWFTLNSGPNMFSTSSHCFSFLFESIVYLREVICLAEISQFQSVMLYPIEPQESVSLIYRLSALT